jgi:hypothetical protein
MYNLPQDTKGKIYVTKAGYVIPFLENRCGDPDYCPLTNSIGQSGKDRRGWIWLPDGRTIFDNKETAEALEIVGEYNYPFQLPSGYRWKGGFPKLEEVRTGDFFLSNIGNSMKCIVPVGQKPGIGNKRIILERAEQPTVPKKLEVGKVYLTKGGWLVRVNSIRNEQEFFLDVRTSPGHCNGATAKDLRENFQYRRKTNDGWVTTTSIGTIPAGVCVDGKHDGLRIISEYTDKLNPEFPDPPNGYKWKHGFPKVTAVAAGEPYVNQYSNNHVAWACENRDDALRLCLVPAEPEKQEPKPSQEAVNKLKDIIASNSGGGTVDIVWGADFSGNCVSEDFSNKKEEVMKKETAIAASKAVGSFAWKTVNYLFLETATEIGKRIGRSIRYAVFFGTVSTVAGMYFAPDTTKGFIKSCLPKVSISVDAPDIVK